MRIVRLLANAMALLEDGRTVNVSHQDFCIAEAFGEGHDDTCPCLDYKVCNNV